MARTTLAFLVLLLANMTFDPLLAQNQSKPVFPAQQSSGTPPRAARPSDVASPDAILAPEDFIERAGNYFKNNGFYEREIPRRTERWGSLMQASSTYESRHDPKDPVPFARGINSFQLFFDGTRWWVMTIYWADESTQTPLPPEFLTPSH
jgi:hypothetical protein